MNLNKCYPLYANLILKSVLIITLVKLNTNTNKVHNPITRGGPKY